MYMHTVSHYFALALILCGGHYLEYHMCHVHGFSAGGGIASTLKY